MACNSCISTLSGFGESVVDTASGTVTTNGQTRSLTETEKNLAMGVSKMFGAIIVGPVIGAVAGTIVGALAWSGKRWAGGILGFVGGGLVGGGIGTLLAQKAAKDHLEPAFNEIGQAWSVGGSDAVVQILPGTSSIVNAFESSSSGGPSLEDMLTGAMDDVINQAKVENPVASAIIGSNNDKVIGMLPGALVKPISPDPRLELIKKFSLTNSTRPTVSASPSSTSIKFILPGSATAPRTPPATPSATVPRTPLPLPGNTAPTTSTKISLRGIF